MKTDFPEWRAAATDLSERRRSGVSRGPVADLEPGPGMTGIVASDGGVRIGALVSIAAIGADAGIGATHPGVAAAAQGLATPQIRHMATLGGNLAQRSRCWYFRSPGVACLKGGESCPARTGNHLYGVAFDTGGCVAPHPSTMAAALMAYEAVVHTDRREALTVASLLGDGSLADNALEPGEVIAAVELPPAAPGERAVYRRAISRARAEWPLVELVARLRIENGAMRGLRLVAGGIAPVPLRLTAAEAAGEGAGPEAIAAVARAATEGARPLPMTGYKVRLLEGLVQDVLERCLAG